MVRLSQVAHFLHGAIAGALWWVDWKVSLFLFLQFFAYEWVEESKVKDEMYHELQEWALGFATFLSLVLLVKILYTSTGI